MHMTKKIFVWMLAATLICGLPVSITSCSKNDAEAVITKNYFPSWNNCEALTALQEYVEEVTKQMETKFIKEEGCIASLVMYRP